MEMVNTALCSFGMSGRVFHAPFIQAHPGFQFYACLERSKNLAQQTKPDVKIFRSLDEMLADKNIDLVVVNTPNDTHFEFAKKALLAGKHVLVEKPFTVRSAEAATLMELAAAENKQIAVYQNRRWDSDFKTVKKIMDEGVLGKIVETEIRFDRYKPTLTAKLHKEQPGPGAGILYDLGPHLIDQALHLFGMPREVFADIRIVRPVAKVDDYFELLLYYDQLRVRLKASLLARTTVPSYILHGINGSFFKTRGDVQEDSLQAGEKPGTAKWGREPLKERGWLQTEMGDKIIKKRVVTEPGNYMAFYHQLHAAITNGAQVPVSAAEALNVITIIEAAVKSSAQKKVVELY